MQKGRANFGWVVYEKDRIALMVYQVRLAHGESIPQDVGVLGYDNMVGTGDLFLPPLSTVQLPHYDIGRLSALHIINGNSHCDTIKVNSPLLLRDSL